MIEIKDVRDLEDDKEFTVPVAYTELQELLDDRIKYIKLYGKLKTMILDRYVENKACFGNGGTITYEELAELFSIELPYVAHIGMDAWLEIKKGVNK